MIGIHTKLTHETPKTAFLTHRCAIGAAELPCIPGRKRHRTIEAPDPNHAIVAQILAAVVRDRGHPDRLNAMSWQVSLSRRWLGV